MSSGLLKQLAEKTGALALLDGLGIRRVLAEQFRRLTSPEARARWHLIRQDFEQCRDNFSRISHQLPFPDPARTALMISSFPTVMGLKLEGILSMALRLKKYRPLVLELDSADGWSRKFHRLFGNREFLEFRRFSQSPGSELPSDIVEFKNSSPSIPELVQLDYRKVDIGRIALSNVLYRHKFSRLELKRPETLDEICTELVQVRHNVESAGRMLDTARPEIAFVLEKGISPAAEVFGACIARGIPVIQYVGSQKDDEFALKRYSLDNRYEHPFSLDISTWEEVKKMPWSADKEEGLLKEFAESYKAGTWFNRKFLQKGKEIKPGDTVRQQLGLDPSKKTAVVFSHVLWDATFFYGKGLFDDYETWLVETVKAACANPALNWVIKLHPDLVWKLKHEGHTGELRDLMVMRGAVGELPGHVKVVLPETDISTYSFFEITDYCLTVRGTVGIEMSCHRVPVFTAGTGRYSGLGFTFDSVSKEEYLERLASLQEAPGMSDSQVELARRYAYSLFKLRAWEMQSFDWVKMPEAEVTHPLKDNILPRVRDFGEFSRALDVQRFIDWVSSTHVDYFKKRPIATGD